MENLIQTKRRYILKKIKRRGEMESHRKVFQFSIQHRHRHRTSAVLLPLMFPTKTKATSTTLSIAGFQQLHPEKNALYDADISWYQYMARKSYPLPVLQDSTFGAIDLTTITIYTCSVLGSYGDITFAATAPRV